LAVALGGGWHSREGENRAVGLGILVSLALHAALLVAFPGILERKRPSILPGPLTARLIPPPVAAPPAVETPKPPAEAPKPQAEAQKPPPAKAAPAESKKPAPLAKPAPQAKPAPHAKPAPRATPAPQAKPSPVAEAPAAVPPAPAAQAAPPAPAVTARTEPQPAAPSVEEAGTIARFRLDIIAAAKRFKRYPRVAMDNNWEGRTDVRIVFGADGKRLSTSIARSSGHEALDRQALDTLSKAFVPVPPALRGKQFEIEIPVIYNLKDENA
jgi:protein TonB